MGLLDKDSMRHALLLAAGAIVGVAMMPWPALGQVAQPGRVIALRGNLSVKRIRQPALLLRLNDAVESGDELITDERSEATIQTRDGSTVHIFPSSRVIFDEQSPDIRELLHLFFGSVKVHIEKLSGRPNPQMMTTPTAVIAVRGTTFSVFVDENDATMVAVDEGTVAVANVRSPADEVILNRGERTWVRRNQPPVRAERFRGRSERADLIPAANRTAGMSGRGPVMQGGMPAGMDSMRGMGSGQGQPWGGMTPRPGPPH